MDYFNNAKYNVTYMVNTTFPTLYIDIHDENEHKCIQKLYRDR